MHQRRQRFAPSEESLRQIKENKQKMNRHWSKTYKFVHSPIRVVESYIPEDAKTQESDRSVFIQRDLNKEIDILKERKHVSNIR